MREFGYDSELLITHLCGKGKLSPFKASIEAGIDYDDGDLAQLAALRPRLLERYRSLPDEDLLVSGIMLIARKP